MNRKRIRQVSQEASKPKGWIEKFESAALAVASRTKSKRLSIWVSSFFHPDAAAQSAEKDASVRSTAYNLLLFYFAFSLAFFIVAAVSYLLSGKPGQSPDLLNPAMAVQIILLEPLLNTAVMFLTLGLVYLSARLLGGKAGYVKQAYAIALVFAGWMSIIAFLLLSISMLLLAAASFPAYTTAGAVAALITGIPALSILLVSIGVFLYGLLQICRAVSAVHGITMLRAAAALALVVVFIIVLNVALLAVLGPSVR